MLDLRKGRSAARVRRTAAMLLLALVTSGVVVTGGAASATASTEVAATGSFGTLACWYAAYPPNKEPNGTLKGWGEKWDCGDSTVWTLTLQRHRTSAWWQQEGINFHTGNNWMQVSGPCASGTWTYRTILSSNVGHQMVSANKVITC
ncbi:hypothetical protein AB0B66_09130 [Catellatospora sp. NPDC049111]|uniref:hypothetical protein n=1 Tax=Catellatospora sp. NPDC049111 TaxID=3155271 RepID=UPI003407DAEE